MPSHQAAWPGPSLASRVPLTICALTFWLPMRQGIRALEDLG